MALLSRALEEYPDEQSLSVARAFLDRAHRGRSRAALEALESRAAETSARLAYCEWEGREAFHVPPSPQGTSPKEGWGTVVEAILAEHLPSLADALHWSDPQRQ